MKVIMGISLLAMFIIAYIEYANIIRYSLGKVFGLSWIVYLVTTMYNVSSYLSFGIEASLIQTFIVVIISMVISVPTLIIAIYIPYKIFN